MSIEVRFHAYPLLRMPGAPLEPPTDDSPDAPRRALIRVFKVRFEHAKPGGRSGDHDWTRRDSNDEDSVSLSIDPAMRATRESEN